jgi:SSS family solute:Na+ symporter
VTLALTRVLPAGLTGLFCAIIVATELSSHDNFMQTWGAVLLQDVVLPLRKRPFTTKTHIRLLRLSVVGVAAFALVFSCLFPNPQNLLMYFALTNNLWLGGAGAVILGGLYWKRGTTAAAVTALGLGAILSTAGIVVTVAWPYRFDHAFPVNPQWIFFLTLIACSAAYVGVSLMGTPRPDAVPLPPPDSASTARWTDRIFGITPEFTRRDRLIVRLIVGWYLLWLGVFLAGTLYGWIANPGEAAWARFWGVYIGALYGLAIVTTVWFTVAGVRDLLRYLRDLHRQDRDFSDTGLVGPGPSAEAILRPDPR